MAKKEPKPQPEGAAEETLSPIEAELAAVTAELEQTKENWLRLAAEYDNYRKRSQREREELYQHARADTLKTFLPVLDNFERALAPGELAEEGTAEFRRGVKMIHDQMADVMGGHGAESFGEAGDVFDPAFYAAVSHVEDEALGENVVAEVFQRGWRMGEKLLRAASVKVAN